jgi:hypothetical protein
MAAEPTAVPIASEDAETKSQELSAEDLNEISGGVGTTSLHAMEVEPVDFKPKIGSLCGMEVEPVDFVPKPRL